MITNPFVADHPEYQQVRLILSSATPEDVVCDYGFAGLEKVIVTIDDDVITPENIVEGFKIAGVEGIYDTLSKELFVFYNRDILEVITDRIRFYSDDTIEYVGPDSINETTNYPIKRTIKIKLFEDKLLTIGEEVEPVVLPYRYNDHFSRVLVDISESINSSIIKSGVTILGIEGTAELKDLVLKYYDETTLEIVSADKVGFMDDDILIFK